jgi:serine/threonine protein kinase
MWSAVLSTLKLEYQRGEILASKYEVIDLLDRGPLGFSYRVKHVESGRYVRLLMLSPTLAGRDQKDDLIAAVKTARQVTHKSVIKTGELGQHQGVAYITMEDFDGETLRDLMQKARSEGQKFDVREAAQITIGILEAAQALHEQGHVFRALRPEYVLVRIRRTGPRGTNVVVDVRVLGAGLWDLVPSGSLAEDEFSRGEAQYIAPELKSFNPDPSPRNDLYSAGVMFYELLVGAAPLGTFQLPRQRRPELPKHVDDVCELALANSPDDRYPSARDFIADIQRIFQAEEQPDEKTTSRVSPLVWVLGALMVVAFSVVLYQSRQDPYDAGMQADLKLRKEVLEKHPKPTEAEMTAMLERHPPNMAYVPAGPYVAGKFHHEIDVLSPEPNAEVRELPGFLIDYFEYPNLLDAPPRHGVTFDEAAKLCADAGKRLCSADEFEKACKGPLNKVYGYGDTWDADFCGNGIEGVHPSGQLRDCKSAWSVYDIAGNFREWTSTMRGENRALVKGGLAQAAVRGTRCAFSSDESTAFSDDSISFRCCRDLDAPPYVKPGEAPAVPGAPGTP